jgi:hypothetical protein
MRSFWPLAEKGKWIFKLMRKVGEQTRQKLTEILQGGVDFNGN